MSGDDLVRAAAGALYSADPEEFIERRGVLAAEARSAGEASAAKRIAALRKPTRSAWVLNQLVRSAPGVTGQLDTLGEELRAAQGSLDGAAIRELSVRRRQLIGALARQAFAVCGLQSPPAALRDEVTATLGAALADPEVAEQLRAGTLDRVARRDGFGPGAGPALTLVPSAPGRRRAQAGRTPAAAADGSGPAADGSGPTVLRPAAKPRPATAARAGHGPAAAGPAAPRSAGPAPDRAAANIADLAAARASAERRRQAVAAAEHAAAEADRAADAAAAAEQEQERAVALIEEQLADGRRRLAAARQQARRARTRRRQAHQALGRLRK